MLKNVRWLTIGILLGLAFSAAAANAATVSGVVTDGNGVPLFNAHAVLHHVPGPGGPPAYFIMTDTTGVYSFIDVEPGVYRVKADKLGYGESSIIIAVPPEAAIEMNFQLPGDGSQLPPPPATIEVEGWAIVEGPQQNQYFLDEDNDGEPEYHLDFGPPWYQSPSGAQRPNDGDFIEIMGALFEQPVMVDNIKVYEINGLLWWAPPPPPPPPPGGGDNFRTTENQPEHHITGITPNPFNPAAEIRYQLSDAVNVNLAIYDVTGRLVIELVDEWQNTGEYEVTFDASALPSGVYFARLQAGQVEQTTKLTLIK